ncbi:MAG: cytochrome c oxidase accessory protein CcoG [Oligoflexales bacterium]|nr:cytochrome c oxidase accessory protein CcoG [Oligoflexales bacterium]
MQEKKSSAAEKVSLSFLAPTVTAGGGRRWIYPERRKKGSRISLRKYLAVALMFIYCSVPFLELDGRPLLQISIEEQKIYFFAQVLRFHEIHLLVYLLLAAGFLLFLTTAVAGRLWCGLACPQTVFLDWLIRPIEELCEGNASKRKIADQKKSFSPLYILKKFIKHLSFACIAWIIANIFLAYFVHWRTLSHWLNSSPFDHPGGFSVMAFLWLVFYLDFSWFREQFCSFLCPYARFQSLLIDEKTPVVSFDKTRGEPRGKKAAGDCIDCGFCVRVCPTGIDIRNGIQLECIQCFRCADACDEIMLNLNRPLGLVRQASEQELQTQKKAKLRDVLRPRVLFYAVTVLVISLIFIYKISTRSLLTLNFNRPKGTLTSTLPDGRVAHIFEVHAISNFRESLNLNLELVEPRGAELICGPCLKGEMIPFGETRFMLMVMPSQTNQDKTLILRHKSHPELVWKMPL